MIMLCRLYEKYFNQMLFNSTDYFGSFLNATWVHFLHIFSFVCSSSFCCDSLKFLYYFDNLFELSILCIKFMKEFLETLYFSFRVFLNQTLWVKLINFYSKNCYVKL